MVRACIILTTISILLGSNYSQAEPSITEAAPSCPSWKSVVLKARASEPAARLVDVMEGDTASAFLAFINEMPPASNVAGDHIAVVFAPATDRFLFIIGARNCATGIVQVPRAEIQKMIGTSA
ncbi:MAG TPA: hypothetical protein VFA50_18770 [Stellaceae bacterium]|nr:hypothetical protein [Stellaceae bacterium]